MHRLLQDLSCAGDTSKVVLAIASGLGFMAFSSFMFSPVKFILQLRQEGDARIAEMVLIGCVMAKCLRLP